MKIEQLNYMQLKVLLAIYRTGQGHQAATELGMTASAVSRSLKTMREMFNDSLFIRRATGLVPTEKTNELIGHAKDLVEKYRVLESQHSVFDPSKSGGHFVIYAYDEYVYALNLVLKKYVLSDAPGFRVEVRTLCHDYVSDLINGEIDFAVVYECFDESRLNAEMFSETGDIYLLCREGHPLKGGGMSLEQISRYPLVELDNYKDLVNPILVDLCQEQGLQMEVGCYTDSLAAVIQILLTSDAVLLCCNQFTRRMTKAIPGLECLRLNDSMILDIKSIRSEQRTPGNYILYGDAKKSPAFNWLKSKLICGMEKEWRLASLLPN